MLVKGGLNPGIWSHSFHGSYLITLHFSSPVQPVEVEHFPMKQLRLMAILVHSRFFILMHYSLLDKIGRAHV